MAELPLSSADDWMPKSSSPLCEQIARALYRRSGHHVLIIGERGVGKSTLVEDFTRCAVAGDYPYLAEHSVLRIDCTGVLPEEARGVLRDALSLPALDRGILCLDNLGALLRPAPADVLSLLAVLLKRRPVRLIGVVSRWEYQDMVAIAPDLVREFQVIEVPEPDEPAALQIASTAAKRLQKSYAFPIPEVLVAQTVRLASTYLLGERHPAKAISLLREVCDDVAFDRTQRKDASRAPGVQDVVRVISQRSGIPPETVAGESPTLDFEDALRSAVVGQEAAIRAVADELRLIKAGMTDPDKPASVMLFAGMTGVGKTELAKRVAELYSASKRLQVYTMANFIEAHSVSGIIGVPAGYVGHDQGGRLINELIADPYAVVLLDEAEKPHANIWKPFLNLFDEGWIVDQRGVKAYADQAIFILTTNAGDDTISQMLRSNTPLTEISDRVIQILSRVRQERSSQPVFTPQFLARIKRVIVFDALDLDAMRAITQKQIRRIQSAWLQKRGQELVVAPEVVEKIAQQSHERNAKSGGKEGGRIVRKLISEQIESLVQREACARPHVLKSCRQIQVSVMADNGPFEVSFVK